ncbi:SRPBCC domain-containing protein [Flavobacterium sp.]|uniref:SRPBCC domain-containing protein n=1 Tax=Flavobacterium sp. TaxID=239 RepID=UPI0039E63A82
MERKTKIHAEEGQQQITITREFDLPLELLFKGYTLPELVSQWMGTNVLKLDNHKHGSYRFETSNPQGIVVLQMSGEIHEFLPNQKITRTFEMENTPFEPQLEFLEFESLDGHTSKLTMHIIYRSIALRDQQLQLPFAQGINMAHDRLQEIVQSLKP